MTEVVRSQRIPSDLEAVWSVLDDFGAIASWADNVDHSCILHEADDSVGTARRIQAGRNVVVERIVEHDPPATLAYDIEGLPRRLRRVHNRWTLTSVAPGETLVELTTTVEIGSRPPQRLAEQAVARLLAKQSETMLACLARRVEADLREAGRV